MARKALGLSRNGLQIPDGLKAQVAEQVLRNRAVMGPNPVQASIFSGFLTAA